MPDAVESAPQPLTVQAVEVLTADQLFLGCLVVGGVSAYEISKWRRQDCRQYLLGQCVLVPSVRELDELASDRLFHGCVAYGADRAAVAGWPDFKRFDYIKDNSGYGSAE